MTARIRARPKDARPAPIVVIAVIKLSLARQSASLAAKCAQRNCAVEGEMRLPACTRNSALHKTWRRGLVY